MTQDAVQGGLNLVTSYGYDEVGNRISQTDANQRTTTYGYDNLGRRTSRKLPGGQSESYTYDSAGNLKTKVDFNGKTTTYGRVAHPLGHLEVGCPVLAFCARAGTTNQCIR